MRILVLCTGNRCRSQMAHGILKHIDPTLDVHSAGVKPAAEVHPLGVKVMQEIGIDISKHYPKHIDQYLGQEWNYVITVCGGAKENCPLFTGKVGKRLHIGFDDPDAFKGSEEEVLPEFRRVRDEIKAKMEHFYLTEIKGISIECDGGSCCCKR
ncbi:MAG: arsenate reductase ArsC [Bacteroidales bacterium]|nr:arsenate reductase ArsC [Candidatus Physcocola equi]